MCCNNYESRIRKTVLSTYYGSRIRKTVLSMYYGLGTALGNLCMSFVRMSMTQPLTLMTVQPKLYPKPEKPLH